MMSNTYPYQLEFGIDTPFYYPCVYMGFLERYYDADGEETDE